MSGEAVTGLVVAFAGATAPDGWLFCDGAAVSRATYGALFTAIGTAYGTGDGSTTFNVPNLSDRSPTHAGRGSFQYGSHGHGSTGPIGDHSHSVGFSSRSTSGGPFTPLSPGTQAHPTSHSHPGAQTTGAGGAHSHPVSAAGAVDAERGPFIAMNYIIKT